MKLTPLDIHHKEFRRSLRGYDEKEVDDFLDGVADEFERLFKENIDQAEKLTEANDQLRRYQVNEQTIQNTMLAAQSSAEHIVNKANADADQVLRDAELKAKEIIHHALQQKQRVAGELVRIKAAEEDFRARFRTLLDAADKQVAEVMIPQDVASLLSEGGEGGAADAADVALPVPPAAQAPAPDADSGEVEAPAPEPAPEQPTLEQEFSDLGADAVDAPDAQAPEAAAEEGAFVQGVQLGEVEPPDLDDGRVELGDPAEFRMPTLDSLGDREDDSDIEEID